MPRPLVINAKVINLLNKAPVANLRPALGSLIQRKTLDIGCYPFPFMVNENNVPLDGRVIGGTTLDIRPVPYWCSENAYAEKYGDTTYNNGDIVWSNGAGEIKSKTGTSVGLQRAFLYDSALGVTYPTRRTNISFANMDDTVPIEWENLKNAYYNNPNPNNPIRFNFEQGETFGIASNVLFKMWSGLTFEPFGEDGGTYQFVKMQRFIGAGGTSSTLFKHYNFGCLNQIFGNDGIMAAIGGVANEFWEGGLSGYNILFGVCGGLSGELFLLNTVYGGPGNENLAGSYYLETPGASASFPYDFFAGATAGSTFSGRQLAINMYEKTFSLSEPPFLRPDEPYLNTSFVDTMALLLGTQQKTATLVTGGTASIRSIDYNNPCADSLIFREDTELGRWGYDVARYSRDGVGDQEGEGICAAEYGCHIASFQEYVNGPTAKQNGIVHPLSWMFWRGISGGSVVQGFVHDYVGDDDGGDPQYNKLEGIHDHLCYEYLEGGQVRDRVYYPLRPITKTWYNTVVAPNYTLQPSNHPAKLFGLTLDKKYSTGFGPNFRDDLQPTATVSLQWLSENFTPPSGTNVGATFSFPSAGGETMFGVTGVMFPYMIPIASYGMRGITSSIGIAGDFPNFATTWTRESFSVQGVNPPDGRLYPYFADGVSSGASFGIVSSPYAVSSQSGSGLTQYDFRLYSWDALNRILPKAVVGGVPTSALVQSSFNSTRGFSLGSVNYYTSDNGTRNVVMNGQSVSVDPVDFPPRALPASQEQGLGLTLNQKLGCDSYVNLIRIANNRAPNDAANIPGLTAKRTLIAEKALNESVQTFLEFDSDSLAVPGDPVFDRRTVPGITNAADNFYTYSGANGNFFFNTSSTNSVFGQSYYLTAQEYYNRYVVGTFAGNWWENVDFPSSFDYAGVAEDILTRLVNPQVSDGWAFSLSGNRRGTRGEFYEPSNFSLGTNGIREAMETYHVHPAFVYRLFTLGVMDNEELEEGEFEPVPYHKLCARDWLINGQPCHTYAPIWAGAGLTGNPYFTSGQTGCDKYGAISGTEPGTDFFDRYYLDFDQSQGQGTDVWAYDAGYYRPGSGSNYNFQNEGCSGAGGSIPDPPTGATLTAFGLKFAEALAAEQRIDLDYTDPLAVRNLFGFSGSTGTTIQSGSDNQIGVRISDWLQEKLQDAFIFYNEKWNSTDLEDANRAVIIDDFFAELYGNTWTQYAAGLVNGKQYRLWTVQPRCVGEYDPECVKLANDLVNANNPVIPPVALQGDGSNFGGGSKSGRFTIGQNPGTVAGIPFTPTANTQNGRDQFLGAFQTLYIEPLGKAPNVLATEAQAVARATIRSTVFGKLTTVIDDRGMLRDVYSINLESGFGTKITGNTAANAITISVEGLSLGSLTDVASDAATDGDVLSYDLVNARWINRSLYDLNDIHSGMPYIFSGNTQPLFNLNIGQVGGADLTTVLANAGTLKFNGKPEKTPTEVYFSVSDANGNNQTGLFNRFGTGVAGTLLLKKFGDPNTFYRFQVDGLTGPYAAAPGGSAADTGVQVSLINSGTGTLSEGDRLTAFLFLEPATNRVNFYYQALPPTGAGVTGGSRWMNSETGTEYIYINDGNSNQWVQAV